MMWPKKRTNELRGFVSWRLEEKSVPSLKGDSAKWKGGDTYLDKYYASIFLAAQCMITYSIGEHSIPDGPGADTNRLR